MQSSGAEYQRMNSAMEDTIAMTVDFLRARLLSERSVLRTARQRADQLAKRVVELEEQLRIVSIQRKKAEKAAAEVLAILESNGIRDISEGLDSSSDQDDVLGESKESNNYLKEDEHSMTSKMRREAEDGLLGSELEASSTPGRSFSWKSGSYRPNSSGRKNFAQPRRRHSSFISTDGSSPKHLLGKSCRQTKRRETRTAAAAADVRDASLLLDAQENGVATGLENRRNENDAGLHANGSDTYGEMERALEQQAQLIGQYEAEENAQREWEEKYRDNNYALDSCEPGNLSDITEEKNEPQTNEDTEPVDPGRLHEGPKPEIDPVHSFQEITTRTPSDVLVPIDPTTHDRNNLHAGMELPGQQGNRMDVNEHEIGFQEFVFPVHEYLGARMKGKQPNISTLCNSNFQSLLHGSPESGSVVRSFFRGDGSFSEGERSGNQNPLLGMQQRANSLGVVLESLQHAKLSLQHELRLSSPSQGSMVTVPETLPQSINVGVAMGTSLGSAGLFRLPTESQNYTSSPSNFSTPYSDFGSTRHSSDTRFSTASSYQYATNPYLEAGSLISAGQSYFDPYLVSGMGIRAPNRYSIHEMDLPNAIIPAYDRCMTPYSDTRTGMPSRDRYSFYDDRFRSTMHR